MFPTSNGGNDIELSFNPESFIAALDKANRARADFEKGVEGSGARMSAAYDDLTKKMVTYSSRAEQAQNRYIKSLEMTASAYGRTGVEKLIAQRDQILKQYPKMEDADNKQIDRIKRITAAYQKMIEVEQNSNKGGGSNQSGLLALHGVRDLFEGRTAYGEVQIGKSLASLSGAPLIIGGLTAALAASAVASYKAAEAVGEYGNKIHNAELVTGMTARQVQQFDFAAKVTGQDTSVLDRMMRGLTQAVSDTGSQGQKARQTLQGMGVDLLSLETGATGTMDLFSQVSTALAAQPDLWLRNKDAIELFKRAGITSLPTLLEMNQALKDTEGINFFSEKQVQQAVQMHREIALVGTEFDQLILSLKAAAAQPFNIVLRFMREQQTGIEFDPVTGKPIIEPYTSGNYSYPGAYAPLTANLHARTLSDTANRPPLEMIGRRDYLASLSGSDAEAAEKKAGDLKKIYDETRDNLTSTVAEIKAAGDAYERQKNIAESIRKSESDRKSNLEEIRKLQTDMSDRLGHPYGELEADKMLREFSRRSGVTPGELSSYAATLNPLRLQEVQTNMRVARGLATSGAQRISDLAYGVPKTSEDLIKEAAQQPSKQGAEMLEEMKNSDKINRQGVQLIAEILTTSRKSDLAAGEAQIRLSSTLAPNTIENRLAAESQISNLKKQSALEEYEDAKSKISDEYEDKGVRELAYKSLRLKYNAEVAQDQQQLDEQIAQERRRQLDEIKGTTEGLLHTLFTHPGKFGGQLAGTLREASLKPVIGGLSQMTASALQPLIFGSSGTGGIAGTMRGMFGGGTSIFSTGGYGGGGGTVGYGGGVVTGGGGGVHLYPTDGTGVAPIGGYGIGMGWPGSDATGGAAPDLYDLPSINRAGGVGMMSLASRGGGSGILGGIGHIFGGGGTSSGGTPIFASGTAMLKSLRGGLGGFTHEGNVGLPGTDGQPGTDLGSGGGKITGVNGMAGAALFTGGTMLAQNGLLGNNRGTGGGVLEGAAGGAAMGFAVGGPIGAGIGALVGLGIGLGEMIAGVESPRNEAKRLVQTQYHISINNSMADQIVALAGQKYGNTISVAVRSPEVRQMLGLYAAGTGQKFPQSSDTPHGASLIESGGKLSQGAEYQYGQAYSYASNLPVYGGMPTQQLPNPGGATIVVNNSLPGDQVGRYMEGQTVSTVAMASTRSTIYDPGSIVS